MIISWNTMMRKLRVHPGAVARQLLANLKTHKPLTSEEESKIIRAIESTGVENATDRMLASLSRNTLNALLNKI